MGPPPHSSVVFGGSRRPSSERHGCQWTWGRRRPDPRRRGLRLPTQLCWKMGLNTSQPRRNRKAAAYAEGSSELYWKSAPCFGPFCLNKGLQVYLSVFWFAWLDLSRPGSSSAPSVSGRGGDPLTWYMVHLFWAFKWHLKMKFRLNLFVQSRKFWAPD